MEENLEYLKDCRKTRFAGVDEAGERYKSGMELESEGKEKQALEKPDVVTDSHSIIEALDAKGNILSRFGYYGLDGWCIDGVKIATK